MKLNYIFDSVGNRYIGINIPKDIVMPYLKNMANDINDDSLYNEYIEYKEKRDGSGEYHITVINSGELRQINKSDAGSMNFVSLSDTLFDMDFRPNILGVGKANKNENSAYFLVVKCKPLNDIREQFGLEPKDLHITIGFRYKDVFGVPKDEVLITKPAFKRTMKGKYFESHETLEFLKNLEGYEYDINTPIDTIRLYDSYGIFRVGENDYFQVSIIDDQLGISGKWKSEKRLARYAQTLIYKYMLN